MADIGTATGAGGIATRGSASTLQGLEVGSHVAQRGGVKSSGSAYTLSPGALVNFVASGSWGTPGGAATVAYEHAFQARKGIRQTVSLLAGEEYTVSAYVRRKTGWTSPYVVAIFENNGKQFEGRIVATPSQIDAQTLDAWVRYELKVTPIADRDKLVIAASGSSGAKIDIASPQVNRGKYARAYIPTTTFTSSGKILAGGAATTQNAPWSNDLVDFTGTGTATATGAAETGTFTMSFALPTSDVALGDWIPLVPGSLFSMMDESANDSEAAIAEATSGEFEVALGPVANSGSNESHIVVVRAKGDGLTLTLKVYDGATLIATRNQALTSTLTTYQLPLLASEVANITNRADVRIRGAVA